LLEYFYGKENSSQILDLFKEHIRDYDLDQKDLKGNSGNVKKNPNKCSLNSA